MLLTPEVWKVTPDSLAVDPPPLLPEILELGLCLRVDTVCDNDTLVVDPTCLFPGAS